MLASDLKNLKKSKKRIGRGGKRGTYSGRGIKGERSRAGHRLPKQIREAVRKIPKLRGVHNMPAGPKSQPVNLNELEKISETAITVELLFKTGLIKNRRDPVKILGDGILKKPVIIHGIPVSKSAREKIEKAGGRVL